ncbi:MAG TPA: site-2 protease family protein [Pyrinomonadaceae bacterium]|nr:site-2 protease family protein [Pyrinomonadaceae bacterium]
MSESVPAIPPFIDSPVVSGRGGVITKRDWSIHIGLFLVTFLTTTFAGIVIAAPEIDVAGPEPAGIIGYLLYIPEYYLRIVGALVSLALANPNILGQGLIFSGTLLTILTAHEMGHYIACRRYGVSATLPFFIPAPPLFLAGTFGAFIKMKSPIPSRRALFDIGLAGPLAGFIALLPFSIMGILMIEPAPPHPGGSVIMFNDPLLFRIIAKFTGARLADALPNPFYMSAWIGLLVTSLNLMPVGQLDGGHGSFALFGQRAHKLIGRVAFAAMVLISVLGFFWHGSPSGFLYAVLLAIMLRVHHPAPQRMEPLGRGRTVVAILTLIVFVLSFWPFPITLT